MQKSVGKVLNIFINARKREEINACELDINGIVNDKHYAKDLNRSILLTSISSYSLAQSNAIEMDIGVLGENILIDYNPYHLQPTETLTLGEVVLEVTQKCTMCEHLSCIDKKLPKLLKNDRGIFVKVIKKGRIEIGDKIYLCQ